MKKNANKSPRRGTAWNEVSNIDFGAYQLKQNRFAKRVRKEGILLVHDAPSIEPRFCPRSSVRWSERAPRRSSKSDWVARGPAGRTG